MFRKCTQFFFETSRTSLVKCRQPQLVSNRNPMYLLSRDKILTSLWVLVGHYSAFAVTAANVEKSHDVTIGDIVFLFKQWFNETQIWPCIWRNEQLQRDVESIGEILSGGDWGPETETALTQLNVNLTEACVVKVLKLQKNVWPGLKFFDWARKQSGYYSTRSAYCTILKMLSQAKLITVMFDWLESFEKQENVLSHRFYDALIMGYALAGKPELALKVFERVIFQRLELDRFAYNMLLNVLVEENCFELAGIIHKHISCVGFENSSTICIMIKNLCKQDKLDEAKKLLEELRRNGGTLNEAVLDILISALCKGKRIDEACQLIEEFREEGRMSMSKIYDTWIIKLVEEKRVDDALEYFQNRTSEGFVPGRRCYNALLTGLLRKNRLEEVCDLLIEMREKCIFPDKSTMNATIHFFL